MIKESKLSYLLLNEVKALQSTQVRYSYSGSRYYVEERAICIIWGSSRGWKDTDDD